jgi:L-ascorbate metabolism protein UlaG (beta-lactamase superfamily)
VPAHLGDDAIMEASLARDGLIDALHRSRAEELEELNRAHRPARHLSLLGAWAAGWVRRAARVTPEPLPEVGPAEVAVGFVGHASVLVRYPQLTVAVNPMLGRRVGLATRAAQPGLLPADLSSCELVLVSHAGPEFLHLPTLRRLPRRATVVVPPRCAALVSPVGFARIVELAIGSSLAHRGVEIVSTALRHPGPACAYVLRGDGPSVFYCGASGYFSGFAEAGARFRPDVALLPIGGYAPRSFRDQHMSPADALYAFEDLTARMLIPIRHGSFVLSYERLDDPLRWLRRLVAERGLERYVTELGVGGSRKFVDLGG